MAKSKKRYSDKASDMVESAMRRRKRGTLRSSTGAKVTSRDQAVAIGLSEAREKGARVPAKAGGRKTSGRKTSSRSRSAASNRKSTEGRKKTAGRKK
jgi:hypothetical protein